MVGTEPGWRFSGLSPRLGCPSSLSPPSADHSEKIGDLFCSGPSLQPHTRGNEQLSLRCRPDPGRPRSTWKLPPGSVPQRAPPPPGLTFRPRRGGPEAEFRKVINKISRGGPDPHGCHGPVTTTAGGRWKLVTSMCGLADRDRRKDPRCPDRPGLAHEVIRPGRPQPVAGQSAAPPSSQSAKTKVKKKKKIRPKPPTTRRDLSMGPRWRRRRTSTRRLCGAHWPPKSWPTSRSAGDRLPLPDRPAVP